MPSKHKKELQKLKKKEVVELKKIGKWEPKVEKKPVKKIKKASFLQELQNKANQQSKLVKNNTSKPPLGRLLAQILAVIFVITLILGSLLPLFS